LILEEGQNTYRADLESVIEGIEDTPKNSKLYKMLGEAEYKKATIEIEYE